MQYGVLTEMHGYPRPQFRRAEWWSLNGTWEFAFDTDGRWTAPPHVAWTRTIEVPFSPETARSGIADTGFHRACWYRRRFEAPALSHGDRLVVRFGAVDYAATVWVNGVPVAEHEGGYTPFQADVTAVLHRDGGNELVVHARDDPRDLEVPRGKQDWQREPHLIWYPRTSGIWQTVWLERLPPVRIDAVRFRASLHRWEIELFVALAGGHDGLRLRARLAIGDRVIADDAYTVTGQDLHRRIALSDPGVDDSRNEVLWSPSSPTLIDVLLELTARDGSVIDRVESYTALREIGIQGDRITLNGRVYPLRLVLDQGFWPETGMTPPDEDALRRDVELAKQMGFNGVRKHQKIEDPRYLYWADRLGLLVWEEMPSAYRFTARSIARVMSEWRMVIDRDVCHPCIAAWVPFNESWGVPNLLNSPAERHYVQALYHMTKTLDPTRPVIGNDGWESVTTDIIGVHDYDVDPNRIARRYHAMEERVRLFQHERPGGRLLLANGHREADHPIVLSEFGGIALRRANVWGYSRCDSAEEFAERYRALLRVVHNLQMLAGFCYTQFADTFQEANGLLYADRRPKFPMDEIAMATRGPGVTWEQAGLDDKAAFPQETPRA